MLTLRWSETVALFEEKDEKNNAIDKNTTVIFIIIIIDLYELEIFTREGFHCLVHQTALISGTRLTLGYLTVTAAMITGKSGCVVIQILHVLQLPQTVLIFENWMLYAMAGIYININIHLKPHLNVGRLQQSRKTLSGQQCS